MEGQLRQVGSGKEFVAVDSLRGLSSIVASHEAPTVSRKYSFFSTMNVVDALLKQNWFPVMAQEQKVRQEERMGYQKHMIRFRQTGSALSRVGDIAPEIVLTNAHDARSAYVLMVGFFRLACLNGLIVSEGEFGAIRIKHIGYDEGEVIDASYKVIQDVPRLIDKVSEYRQIELKPEEKNSFAESALILKYSEDDQVEADRKSGLMKIGDRTFSVSELLRPRRVEDQAPTLWNTFNAIQEKITKGNKFERTTRMINNRIIQRNKVKGITAINENIRFNRGLWHLMEKMREIKSARNFLETSVNLPADTIIQ